MDPWYPDGTPVMRAVAIRSAAMGKRSRERRPPGPRPARAPRPAPLAPGREKGFGRLPAARRTLAIYLAVAMLVALVTLVGIAVLGGTLGPYLVFAFSVVASGLLFRWAQGSLAGAAMSDEDRVMQTMAAGLLLISTVLALVSAIAVAAT
jgi:hypothetical protein